MPKTFSFTLCAFVLATCQPGRAQDFWQQTAGPTGGSVQALTTTAGGLVVAGTAGGGVFVSNNDGLSWTAASGGLTSKNVYSLIALPSSILAGTGGGGVFRSTDNGLTWNQSGLDPGSVLSFAYQWPGYVFAGGGIIHRSSNEGQEWEQTPYPPSTDINAMLALSDVTVLVGTSGNGMLKTTDAGDTWVDASTGMEGRSIHALAYSGSGWVLAGTDGGIFRSTNEGGIWIQMTSDSAVLSLVLDGQGLNYAGTESGKILRSFNDGASWDDVSIDTPVAPVLSLGTGPSMSVVAGFEQAGVYRTVKDGELWTNGNSGLIATDVRAIAVSPSGAVLVGTEVTGLLETTDGGESWEPRNSGLGNRSVESILVRANGDLFVGTEGGVFKSVDNGQSWTPSSNGITDSLIYALAENSNGTLFAGTISELFRSTDGGSTWIDILPFPERVISIAVDQSDRVIIGTGSDGAYRSTDNGDTWKLLGGNFETYDIAFNSLGYMYLATEWDSNVGRLDRSTDDGQTWEFFSLDSHPIYTLAVDDQDRLYAGTSVGPYISTDLGETWTQELFESGTIGTWRVTIDSSRFVWAGTFNNGAFRSIDPLTSVGSNVTDLPAEFRLEQNYPNPFNAISNFEVGVAELSFATLKIYDLLGQDVTTLFAETVSPGMYRVQWDATGYPSGIYFYRFQAGDFVEARKLVLLK